MRINIQKDWHRWFAWFPVHLDDDDYNLAWFEYVWRKKAYPEYPSYRKEKPIVPPPVKATEINKNFEEIKKYLNNLEDN